MRRRAKASVNDQIITALTEGRLHDPHSALGVHPAPGGFRIRHLDPAAARASVRFARGAKPMQRLAGGVFELVSAEPPRRP